jgi:hypothetical protein
MFRYIKINTMNILIACEESQAVCKEFRRLGHNAFSCDILPATGGHPEWHIQRDVFEVIDEGWDMMIAFPPCTYLSVSGAQWYYDPEDKHLPVTERRPHPKYPNRAFDRYYASEFFMKLYNSPIDRVCIENPVGVMSSLFRKPDQVIQPWMFGDEATKTTCIWLKGLPTLAPTNIVGKGDRTVFKSGKSHPKWYADALAKAKTPEERRNLRSKTFPGIASAMAEQWTNIL